MQTSALVRYDSLDHSRGQPATFVCTTHERSEEGPDPHAAWDDMVCRAIGRVLHSHYRGHDWNVWVSRASGIAKIHLSALMSPQYPFVIRLHEGLSPEDVIRAGGELLERFNIPRSTVDFGAVLSLKNKLGPLANRMAPPGGLGRI